MEWLVLVFFWLLFASLVGMIASGRGRSFLGWFLLAFLISPLLSLVLVLVLGKPATLQRSDSVIQDGGKVCPRCAESVKRAAQVCRFCGHEFPEAVEPVPAIPSVSEADPQPDSLYFHKCNGERRRIILADGDDVDAIAGEIYFGAEILELTDPQRMNPLVMSLYHHLISKRSAKVKAWRRDDCQFFNVEMGL